MAEDISSLDNLIEKLKGLGIDVSSDNDMKNKSLDLSTQPDANTLPVANSSSDGSSTIQDAQAAQDALANATQGLPPSDTMPSADSSAERNPIQKPGNTSTTPADLEEARNDNTPAAGNGYANLSPTGQPAVRKELTDDLNVPTKPSDDSLPPQPLNAQQENDLVAKAVAEKNASNGPLNQNPAPTGQSPFSDKTSTGENVPDSKPVAKDYGLPKIPNITNFQDNPELNDQAMKDAQRAGALRQLIASVGEAGSTYSSLAAGQKPDTTYYQNLQKNANQDVENIKDRRDALVKSVAMAKVQTDLVIDNLDATRKLQLADPNSPVSRAIGNIQLDAISKIAPEFASTLKNNPDWNNLSGADKKEFTDHMIENFIKIDANKALKAKSQADAEAKQNELMQDKVSKELNTLSQSSRNALGQAGRVMVSADRALKILDQKVVTPEDLNSVSADISNLVSGQATVAGAKDQQYKILQGDLAKTLQRITSNPTDVDAPALKQHLRDVIVGMRQISSGTALQNLNFIKISHPAFATKNPDYFEDIAKSLAGQEAPGSMDALTPTGSKSGLATANASKPASTNNDSVKVISPEGKTGSIPRANLDKALARGFKVVQ